MNQDSPLIEKLKPPPMFENADFLNSAPIRLRPSDLAQLLGVSRARISQLTKTGRIKPFPDGTFCPSAVARELIRTENSKAARSKILVTIREEIDDARRRADEAITARDQVARHNAELLLVLREVGERWLRADLWLNQFFLLLEESSAAGPVGGDELERAWDAAAAQALAADVAQLADKQDPADLVGVIGVDPHGPIAQAAIERHVEETPVRELGRGLLDIDLGDLGDIDLGVLDFEIDP